MTARESFKNSTGSLVSLSFAFFACLLCFPLGAIFRAEFAIPQSYLGYAVIVQFSVLYLAMLGFWRFGPQSQRLSDYRLLIIIAIVLRLVVFPADTYLSNDVERYLFDGYIAAIGMDPYSVAHDAAILDQARDIWQPPAEHLHYVTLYPPLALALFTLAAAFGPVYAFLIWKLMVLLASLGSLFVSLLVLRRAKKLQHVSLVALSPILILESGVGLHVDIFASLAVASAIYALQRGRYFIVGALVGAGALIKILPLALIGPIALALQNKRVNFIAALLTKPHAYLLLGAAFSVVGAYLLAIFLGLNPVGSIGVFFEKFRFASPIYYFFESASSTEALIKFSIIAAAIGLSVVAYSTWRSSKQILDDHSVLAMQLVFFIPLFLSPVVYPWYLAPLVLLVALRPNPVLLVWMGLLPLTYEVLGEFVCCGQWQPQAWPIILISLGIAIAFSISLWRFFYWRRSISSRSLPC